jgi:hypothetical protein
MSLGFVLLVAALLSGLMLMERHTFARMFALDDRRRERERQMWEEDDYESDDDSSSEQDEYDHEHEHEHERQRRDVAHVSWQPRLSINDNGGGEDVYVPSSSPYRVHSVVVSEDGDADGDDEASFAMRRLATTTNRTASTLTAASLLAHTAADRQTSPASPPTTRRN